MEANNKLMTIVSHKNHPSISIKYNKHSIHVFGLFWCICIKNMFKCKCNLNRLTCYTPKSGKHKRGGEYTHGFASP